MEPAEPSMCAIPKPIAALLWLASVSWALPPCRGVSYPWSLSCLAMDCSLARQGRRRPLGVKKRHFASFGAPSALLPKTAIGSRDSDHTQ